MDRRRDRDDDLDLNVTADTAGPDREAAREEAKKNPDPNMSTTAGEVVGGTGGALAGAAAGTVVAGPIGTAIGAIAGAIGGWWAGHEVSEASARWTEDQDRYYREHFESRTDRPADRRYEDFRPAYQLGHVAGHNPNYRGRSFDEIESDLRHGWHDDLATRSGDWVIVRASARTSYETAQRERNAERGAERKRKPDEGDEELKRRY